MQRRVKGVKPGRDDLRCLIGPTPSFLLPSETFILYSKASEDEKLIYLFLAGKRDYLDYCAKGIPYLSLAMVNIDPKRLNLNPLLDIKNNNIYFKSST